MKNLLSILVPVYGVEKYIERCCRSLWEQTYSEIEYIFVDDCSPDNSISVLQRVLEEYPGRIPYTKIIKHAKNKGLASTRNTAISYAQGEYVMCVDSDDYLDKDAVRQLIDIAIKNEADVVVFDAKHVYNKKECDDHRKIAEDKKDYIKQLLTYKVSVSIWGKLFKKTLFMDFGVHFVDDLNFGEDYVVTPRIIYYAQKICYFDRCLYYYTHVNSASYTLSYKPKNIDDIKKAITILSDFFSQEEMAGEYVAALREAKLQSKINILIAICLHKKELWKYLPEVKKLYLDENILSISYPYRFMLWLSKMNYDFLLYLYVITGFRIKQIMK